MQFSKLLRVVAIGGLLASPIAQASDFLGATIEAVRPDSFDSGGVFIRMAGARTGAVTCTLPDGGANNWYFISSSNPLMKELLSTALSAKLSERPVDVAGAGTCTQGYEDIRYIQLN